jgi:DNA-binding IclR family transcriptional regulator
MTVGNAADVPRHQTVRAVVKAMQLLVRIAEAPEGLAVSNAARELGIPAATAYHLVNTMASEGFLTRDFARRYRLGPKIAMLATAYERTGPAQELLSEVRRLAKETGETAYLSAWRDHQVVALATIEGSSTVRVGGIHTELRGMEHARASGKLMLAYLGASELDAFLAGHEFVQATPKTITDVGQLRKVLAEIRATGFAIEESEFAEGVGCVAAPVLYGATCSACITISAPLERFHSHRQELTDAVARAAASHSAA